MKRLPRNNARVADADRPLARRKLLQDAAVSAVGLIVTPLAYGQRTVTEGLIEGPFYPPEWPRGPLEFPDLDDDADLLWVKGKAAFASGVILHLAGRVLDDVGNPLPNKEVQIWQVDNNSRYHHIDDDNPAAVDESFQGFGRTVTDAAGRYRFRTIRPVPYPGRTPHIHFRVRDENSEDLLTTQMFIAGEPGNAEDALYQDVPRRLRRTVTVRLRDVRSTPVPGGRRKTVRGWFALVLGVTPAMF